MLILTPSRCKREETQKCTWQYIFNILKQGQSVVIALVLIVIPVGFKPTTFRTGI